LMDVAVASTPPNDPMSVTCTFNDDPEPGGAAEPAAHTATTKTSAQPRNTHRICLPP
jgi:hypothetical protein